MSSLLSSTCQHCQGCVGSIWKGFFLRISLLGWRCAEYTGWLSVNCKWEESTLKYMCKVFENHPKGRHQHALGKIFLTPCCASIRTVRVWGTRACAPSIFSGLPFILIKLIGATVLKGQKSDLPEYLAKGHRMSLGEASSFPHCCQPWVTQFKFPVRDSLPPPISSSHSPRWRVENIQWLIILSPAPS